MIDGQQRLVTLQLVLALIRDRWAQLGESHKAHNTENLITAGGWHDKDDEDGSFIFRCGDANWEVLRDFVLRAPDDSSRRAITNKDDKASLSAEDLVRNRALLTAYRGLSHDSTNTERRRGHW